MMWAIAIMCVIGGALLFLIWCGLGLAQRADDAMNCYNDKHQTGGEE